jgi:hypothetical protein
VTRLPGAPSGFRRLAGGFDNGTDRAALASSRLWSVQIMGPLSAHFSASVKRRVTSRPLRRVRRPLRSSGSCFSRWVCAWLREEVKRPEYRRTADPLGGADRLHAGHRALANFSRRLNSKSARQSARPGRSLNGLASAHSRINFGRRDRRRDRGRDIRGQNRCDRCQSAVLGAVTQEMTALVRSFLGNRRRRD